MEINKDNSVALMKTVFLSIFWLAPRGWAITIECNILGFVVAGDEEMKRGKNVLRKLVAAETLNNIAIDRFHVTSSLSKI